MSRIGNSTPGSWYDQPEKPFVMPTQAEIEAADEAHDMERANRSTVPLLFVALVFYLGMALYLIFS
jgi:hypothetical protein